MARTPEVASRQRRQPSAGQDPVADLCLVLEGTYPFVQGGVSAWVHQLVTSMPEFGFSILHVSPRPGFYTEGHAYQMPANLVALDEVYLHTPVTCRTRGVPRAARRLVGDTCAFLAAMRRGDRDAIAGFAEQLDRLHRSGLSSLDLLASAEHWEVLTACYREEASHLGFLDFYRNWISAHRPLLDLLTSKLPRARAYHTVSTGYAGLLAALASHRYDAPMVLTEHGIHPRQRPIDIDDADWVPVGPAQTRPDIRSPYFQDFWNRHFSTSSRLCYAKAERIFALYTGTRDQQILDGASPEKISIVPNGIDPARFAAAAARHAARHAAPHAAPHAARPADPPFTVGFVGRVCPSKDLRTFIAAMRLVADVVDDLEVHIMGSTAEDPAYVEECMRFAAGLELADIVRFRGQVDLGAELDRLDVMVLTSVSEAQPLVILEAGAVGVPVVSTDVGACSELIIGRGSHSRSLGAGGHLTPIASPGATAAAVLVLHDDRELRLRMGQSLQRRVQQYFDQQVMTDSYRAVYQDLLQPEVV